MPDIILTLHFCNYQGICGLPENYDSQRAFNSKLDKLSQLIRQSQYTVVLTGAGISTSAGIPDFRGPSGIWTREQQERKRKKKNAKKLVENPVEKATNCCSTTIPSKADENPSTMHVGSNPKTNSGQKKRKQGEMQDTEEEARPKFTSFEAALPTYTHRALAHLILHPPPTSQSSNESSDGGSKDDSTAQRTYIHHIVTQNVDGLHRKTNLPRNKMSILHGCIFTEMCDTCNTEHVRKQEIQSIGLRHTGKSCTLGGTPAGSCRGRLKDTLLDWEDDLPEMDWCRAEEECSKADLVLCLGTSLRIEPAASLCTYPTAAATDPSGEGGTKKKGRKKMVMMKEKLGFAIVNLQQTPYDESAALVVRGKVDDVMKAVMWKLGYGNNWDSGDERG